MDAFTADYLSNLAAELSAPLIAKVARRFQQAWQGDEMAQALQRCLHLATLVMVSRANADTDEEALLADIFSYFFQMDAVATQLLPLVRGKPLDTDELAFLFAEAGYDADTLPGINFSAAIAAFEAAFLETAAAEPALQPLIQVHQDWAQTELQQEMVASLRQMLPILKEALNRPIGIQAGSIVAKNVANQQTIYQTVYQWGGAAAAPPPTAWEPNYLKAVVGHCSELDLTLLDASEARHERLTIATVFTALNLHNVTRAEGQTVVQALTPTRQPQNTEKRDLSERVEIKEKQYPIAASEAIAAMPRLVILGQPGGGKSTLSNHIVTQLARRRLGETDASLLHWPENHTPLPVRIVLRHFASWLVKEKREGVVGDIWAYLAHLLDGWGCPDSFSALKNALRTEGSIVFFDGLDELRETHLRKTIIRDVVQKFADIEKQCQIIITSRPYAYEANAAWRLPEDEFVVVQLAPFGEEQIKAFNDAWYTKVIKQRRGWNLEKSRQEAARLSHTILARPHLHRLAQSPLLLTLIAQVDSSGGDAMQLNNRAQLYERTVNLLLARWDNRIRLDDYFGGDIPEDQILYLDGLPTLDLRDTLAKLAYEGHRQQEQQVGKSNDAIVEIPYQQLRNELLLRFDSLKRVEEIITYIRIRTGLLVDKGEDVFTFPHRTYQEYLAGQHLRNTSGWMPRLVKLVKQSPDWWREVFLLNVASMSSSADSVQFLVQALLPAELPMTPRKATLLMIAAQALVETNFGYYVEMEKQQKALAAADGVDEDGFTGFFRRVRGWLEKAMLADAVLPTKTRAEAGQWLARLGDERPGVGVVERDGVVIPDIAWGGEVPVGVYQIGDTNGQYEDEKVREVRIERPYRLARYPITNVQFQCFIDTEDRDNELWWEGLPENEKEFSDPQFPYDNHPRETVSWYQAIAFCRWLNDKLDGEIGLPHEYEWEVAARWTGGGTDGRFYPWKGDFDVNKANSAEGGIGQTTAVGIYPSGKNEALELYDLSGNVLEWCANKYDEDKLAETAVDQSAQRRVLRGGSWFDNQFFARAAYRSSNLPGERDYDVGFRVVVRRPPSHLDL